MEIEDKGTPLLCQDPLACLFRHRRRRVNAFGDGVEEEQYCDGEAGVELGLFLN